MGFIRTPQPAPHIQIDPDTIRLDDLLDTDLSHYFDITIDDANNYVLFNPKIGDLRVQDPDDTDNSDYIQMTTDDASGAIFQATSRITDGNVWEIQASGTISGGSATVDLNYLELDVDGITLNDGAANAITLQGTLIDFNGATLTAVGLSTLYGLNIQIPTITAVFSDGAGLIVAENTNDMIAELCTTDGYGLGISGDIANSGRSWAVISPSATSITADVNNILLDIDITSLTINDGANTPEIRLLRLNADGQTETDVGNTVLYGAQILIPDISTYASGAGLQVAEQINDMVVELCDQGNRGIYVYGDTVEARTWVDIRPSAATLDGSANITLMEIDTDNWIINDGVNTPTYRGLFIDVSAHTETDVNNTTLEALRINMPDISGYNNGGAIIAQQSTNAIIEVLPETDELILLRGDSIEARNWLNIAPNAATINADNNINLIQADIAAWTINDGATTPEIRLARLDAVAGTETDVNGTVLYGMEIIMPDVSAYATCAGIHATANSTDKIVDVLARTNEAMLVTGTAIEAADWISIVPSAATLNADNIHRFFHVDLVNWTINDGVTTPEVTGFYGDMVCGTQTDVGNTILRGMLIGMPDISAYAAASCAIRCEQSTATIVDILPQTDEFIRLSGDSIEARNWINIIPDGGTLISTSINFIQIDTQNWTINDGGNTPAVAGIFMNLDAMTETDVNGTTLYGYYAQMPDISTYAGGAAIRVTETGSTADVMILPQGDQLVLLQGNAITSRNWIEVSPSTATLNAASTINFMLIDTDLWTINDGATSPTVRGLYMNLDDMTETDVGNTTLIGLQIDLPDISTYSAGEAIVCAESTAAIVSILPQTDEMIYVHGDSIESRNWLNIVPDAATLNAGSTINYIHIDTDALIINDGATSPTIRGMFIDFTGMTATDVDGTALRGIRIDMAEVGDYSGEIAIDITSDKTGTNVDNDTLPLSITKDLNAAITGDVALEGTGVMLYQRATSTSAGDFDLTHDGMALNVTMSSTCSASAVKTDPDTFSGTAIVVDIDALTDTNANAALDMSARALDISYTLTETLGTLRLAATDIARITATIPNGITSAGAFQFDMFEINGDSVVLNDANISFYGLNIDFSALTDTSSAALAGLIITMPTATDTALTTNGEIVAGNYPQEDYLPFELWETANESNVTVTQVYDTTRREVVLDCDFTGDGAVEIWCQYRIPSDFKSFANSSDDVVVYAVQDADSGDGVGDVGIDIDVYDDAGTDLDDDTVADTALTGAYAIYDCAISSAGVLVAGDVMMIRVLLDNQGVTAIENGDGARVAVPRVRYERSG